ncbi:HAD-IA family hydrolase [Ferrimonas lipolytica]|uniref:HAD-IA family hydrolase n=1 Tax=Ferrimonas lipolytica TaxID=2724191 RepID=A0A6H1UG85_9GAMM|nr:HAD-IA family hydrolase [Ferrimonas lipolytica]QIZ78115.1 HAD-IA family hydrolase [Ferrimonas lipolytica]
MQFSRRLQPFSAISFDLDDTLYDNKPVLIKAQQRLWQHLRQLSDAPQLSDDHFWLTQKNKALQHNPELIHDTTACRLAALKLGLNSLRINDSDAVATQAMAQFLRWRSEITVAPEVITLLQQLAAKYPLAVITNGNAEVNQFLPQIPFKVVLAAGIDGAMKPAADLFNQCCQQLNIAPQQLLHIGDHPRSDVAGAIQAGCQAVWLSPQYSGKLRPAGPTLPTVTISSLESLRQLV